MSFATGNLFVGLPPVPPVGEVFDVLLRHAGWTVERIVSWGHATASGEWFDQPGDEWVVLLAGRARLQIEGESMARELLSGRLGCSSRRDCGIASCGRTRRCRPCGLRSTRRRKPRRAYRFRE